MDRANNRVVVVGAGLAGLTAAALLQHRGASVTLLESHALPGGCAGWFRHGAFQFAVGATIATGFEPGGLHDVVYRELGITAETTALPFCYDVALPSRRVRVFNDRAQWRRELNDKFGPSAARNMFWDTVESTARATRTASASIPAMPLESPRDLVDLAIGGLSRPGSLRALPYFGQTVDDVMRSCGLDDRSHRTLCRAQILDAMQSETDACPFPNGALALDVYRYGCQYVHGGMGRIARDLLQSFVKNGGTALFRREAQEYLVDAGRVVGVRDEAGQVHTGHVLSALPGDATAALLPGEWRDRLTEREKRAQTGWGAVVLYLEVDERPLPADHPPFVLAVGHESAPLHDGNSIFISTSPAFDRTRAPAGKRAVTISTHVDAAQWWRLDEAAYFRERDAMQRRILSLAGAAVPGLEQAVERVLPATPRTFAHYTRRPLGRVGGIPQTMETANFRALGHRGELPGLWHAGDCVFPGQGAVGVTLGALIASRSISRKLGLSSRG